MKKNATLLLIILAFGLTACGGGSSSSSNDDKNESPAQQEEEAEATTNDDATKCIDDGETLVVAEGATCTDNDHSLKCENGIIIYDSMIRSGDTIDMNGRKYTCE